MERIIKVIAVVIVAILLCFVLNVGIEHNERVECAKWQKQSLEYKNFFLAQWQIDQCKNY